MKNSTNPRPSRVQKKAVAAPTKEWERRARRTAWLVPALVGLLTACAFVPSLQNGFVNWDDYHTLLVNPNYQGFGWTQLRWMFTTFLLGHYQPLSWMSWSLDYLIWGVDPFGYHLTNLSLHTANAVLFYFISRRLLEIAAPGSEREACWQTPAAAAFAALLFAVHPLRVESVAWVTERRDVLSAHFLFWTLLCYFRAATSPVTGFGKARWLAVALACYLLSLLSKAWGITLPVLLLVLDIYPLKRLKGNPAKWFQRESGWLLVEKLPFAVLAVAFAATAFLAQQSADAMASLQGYPLPRRIAQAFYGLVFYLWKTLWPAALSPLYQFYYRFDYLALPFLVSAAVALAITVALFALRKRWPAGLAAWACYVLLLSPVLGLVQSGRQFVADRYTYLSCLSWALLAGAAILYLLPRRRVAAERGRVYLLGGASATLLLILGVLTWRYTLAWRDSESLWRHAVAADPRSSLARLYLGNYLKERGKAAEAIEHYGVVLEIDPTMTEVYYLRGLALAAADRLDAAVQDLRAYIEKVPALAGPHVDLGIILGRQGKSEEQIQEFRSALEIDPGSAEAYYGLGTAAAGRGQLEEAKRDLERAIEINPQKSEFYFTLGNVLVKQNSLKQATESFRQAVKVQPSFAMARNNLGRLLAAQGDLSGAMEQFREALRINPKFAPAHESMAQLLAELGRKEEAMEHYREAVRLTQPAGRPGAQP